MTEAEHLSRCHPWLRDRAVELRWDCADCCASACTARLVAYRPRR